MEVGSCKERVVPFAPDPSVTFSGIPFCASLVKAFILVPRRSASLACLNASDFLASVTSAGTEGK